MTRHTRSANGATRKPKIPVVRREDLALLAWLTRDSATTAEAVESVALLAYLRGAA